MKAKKKFDCNRLKEARKMAGLTYTRLALELADKTGVRRSFMCLKSWEKGTTQPTADDLFGLADFFEQPVEYFTKEEVR